MKIVIDRIEGDFAVCELPDETMVNVPLVLFDAPSEGNVYEIIKNDTEKQERTAKARSLFDKLKKSDSDGE